jgi:V8-like Glu-specific endopeptidase
MKLLAKTNGVGAYTSEHPSATPPGAPTRSYASPVRWLAPVVLMTCACGPTEPAPAHRTDAIVNGTADATASVFMLDLRFSNGDAAICTAVLITPRVLLTAAHCVEPALHASSTVTVKATNKPDDTNLRASDFTAVTVIARHPQWNPSGSMSPYDLAALLLATPSTQQPVPLVRALPANLVGQSLRLVGYGRTGASNTDSGTRRSASVAVTALTPDSISFGTAGGTGLCSGDSGGPAFLTGGDLVERVAGVHSLTRSSSCGIGDDVRVDARLPFIDGFVATNDPARCSADARCATGCATPDPDCPADCATNGVCTAAACGTPDPDCTHCGVDGTCSTAQCPVADLDCTPNCGSDAVCASGACATPDPDCARCGLDGQCSAAQCPTSDPDCASHCAGDGVCAIGACASLDPDCAACGADGVCAEASCPTADPDCLDDGSVCTEATQCTGHECVDDPRGFRFCSRACVDTAGCQLDLQCTEGLCRAPTSGAFGGLQPVRGGCAAAPGFAGLGVLVVMCAGRRNRRARTP